MTLLRVVMTLLPDAVRVAGRLLEVGDTWVCVILE